MRLREGIPARQLSFTTFTMPRDSAYLHFPQPPEEVILFCPRVSRRLSDCDQSLEQKQYPVCI